MSDYELEALKISAMATYSEVEGMVAENTQREIEGKSLAFTEDAFTVHANELHAVAEAIRGLIRSTH